MFFYMDDKEQLERRGLMNFEPKILIEFPYVHVFLEAIYYKLNYHPIYHLK